LRQNLQQVAPNQEKPHTTPLHYLIYSIYISVEQTDSALCISRTNYHAPTPGFSSEEKHGDFFALSLIFLPYILPNLLNKSKR
jgi:hypothetical protein